MPRAKFPQTEERLSVPALITRKRELLRQRHQGLSAQPAPLPASRSLTIPIHANSIALGVDGRDRPVILPERPRLEHMHVLGATGSGKTNFLEHCIRQDILAGRGVCVVDPHGNHPGSLYRSILIWLHETGLAKARPLHLIDPNSTSHAIGFNPLARFDSGMQYSVIAEAMFEAFERMWGDEDGNSKPTIQRVLTATFTALGEQNLTLAEARLLFDPEDRHGIRALVLSKLDDIYAFEEIDYLHQLAAERGGRRDFRAEVIGPINRIAKLVRTEAVRVIVGQTENVLDLREAMDDGHIILANLSGGGEVYEQGADLLGRLLARFIFFHARRRKHPERPYFVYLDECHRYLSGDLPNLLAEIRKYGVGVVLAHQWLAQLGKHDSPIREAVSNGPNLKAVFRVKHPREAAELAESVMSLNLEQPVRALIKPAVVGHRRTIFRNSGRGSQKSTNFSLGQSETFSESKTKTTSVADTISESETDSISYTESDTETEGTSHTEGSNEGFSEGESESYGTTESYGGSTGTTSGSSTGDNRNRTDTSTPESEMTLTPIVSTTMGRGYSSGDSESRSHGSNWQNSVSAVSITSRGHNWGSSIADTTSESSSHTTGTSTGHATTRGTARTTGTSDAETKGIAIGTTRTSGQSDGTSTSASISEGIEPIYADLPTAVHGKDNALYMAAQELMSLKTGEARFAYVGEQGRFESILKVPEITSRKISDDIFGKLRVLSFNASRSAMPMETATQALEDREQSLKAEAASSEGITSDEPASYRTPLPKD